MTTRELARHRRERDDLHRLRLRAARYRGLGLAAAADLGRACADWHERLDREEGEARRDDR